jgi:hypothetical protein
MNATGAENMGNPATGGRLHDKGDCATPLREHPRNDPFKPNRAIFSTKTFTDVLQTKIYM